jgi:hypothetical protein
MRVTAGALLLALLFAAGCGHTKCETAADCPRADQVCSNNVCIIKGPPRIDNPTCGANCTPDALRCDYRPLSVGTERCVLRADGCTAWEPQPDCGGGEFCRETEGCLPRLGIGAECDSPYECREGLACNGACAAPLPEGALCRFDGECTEGMRCSAAGEGQERCRRACRSGSCGAGELCAYSVCIPADRCAACAWGERSCAGLSPRRCEQLNGECMTWVTEETCAGSNLCRAGACVGTLPLGEACAPAAACLEGLVCREDTQRCAQGCSASASCPGEACHVIPASRGQGICTTAAGPTVETRCRLTLGTAVVRGVWDRVLVDQSTWPADVYGVVSIGGEVIQVTPQSSDQEQVTWDLQVPATPFGRLVAVDVALWDDDLNVFVGDELIAHWRLAEHYDWTDGATRWPLTLRRGDVSLTVTIDCTP